MRRSISRLLGAALLATAVASGAAQAENLRDALAKAYVNNPTLRSARAGQRAVDEQVPQALSGWRPSVSVSDYIGPSSTYSWASGKGANPKPNVSNSLVNGRLQVNLEQPVFNGYATVEGTLAAESNVKAGQQDLLATEQQVLFNAVSAYMSVYQYRHFVALQMENVKALEGQLHASTERFKVGEITQTDVAQARASLSLAQGLLETYRTQLAANEATYLQVIGSNPGATPYPALTPVPRNINEAYRIAGELNPTILAQAFAEDAAIHNVGVSRAPLLPQVSVLASLTTQTNLNNYIGINGSGLSRLPSTEVVEGQVGALINWQLYDGGLQYSLVRQAKQVASQQRINVIVQARAVRQVVAAGWNALQGSQAKLKYDNDQVKATQLALDGVKQEFDAGTRTTQDVLDAQQNLVVAEFSTVQDRFNIVMSNYQLLNGMGKLTAADLRLNVPIYDPNQNYRRVRNKLGGTDVETVK
jgi:outer membrane protein